MDDSIQNLMRYLIDFFETFIKATDYLGKGIEYCFQATIYFHPLFASVILVVLSVLLIRFLLLK